MDQHGQNTKNATNDHDVQNGQAGNTDALENTESVVLETKKVPGAEGNHSSVAAMFPDSFVKQSNIVFSIL